MRKVFMTIAALIALSAPPVAANERKPVVAVAEIKDLNGFGEDVALAAMIETALADSGKFKVEPRPKDAAKPSTARDAKSRSGFRIYVTMTRGVSKPRTDVGGTLGTAILGGLLGSRRDGEKEEAQESCAGCVAAETDARPVARTSAGAAKSAACKPVRDPIEIDVRIVDAATGRVSWSNTIRVDRLGCVGGKQARSAAHLRHVADIVVRELTLVVHPIRVAAIEANGAIVLNYGEAMLRVGDTLRLFVPSKLCLAVDPDSGHCLADDAAPLGFVQVTEVTPRFSRAAPVAQLAAPPPIGAIARFAPLPRPRPVKKRPAP